MSLLSQLMRAHARPARREYHPNKTRPEFANSRQEYFEALVGQRKSIPQLAAELGKTYDGARSMVGRLVARGDVVRVRDASIGSAGKNPALYTWNIKREGKMAQWDRFDICEAHCVLEWDFNHGGWLKERPSNVRRRESTGVQLHRMQFKASHVLSYESLSDNGKEIYLEAMLKWKLPIDAEMKAECERIFTPEYLQQVRPVIWPKAA